MPFNIRYFNENGEERHYLGVHTDKATAERWCQEFNRRYRKPYPNGKGYYAAAQVVEIKG
jgi:hypothetical protein